MKYNELDISKLKRRSLIENSKRGSVIRYTDDKGRNAYLVIDRVNGGRVYGHVFTPDAEPSDSMSIEDLVSRDATLNDRWKSK